MTVEPLTAPFVCSVLFLFRSGITCFASQCNNNQQVAWMCTIHQITRPGWISVFVCLYKRRTNWLKSTWVSPLSESQTWRICMAKRNECFLGETNVYWFSWISDGRFYCIGWEELFGAGEKAWIPHFSARKHFTMKKSMTFKIQIFFVTTLIFYKKPQMSKNQIFDYSESSNPPTYFLVYSSIFPIIRRFHTAKWLSN